MSTNRRPGRPAIGRPITVRVDDSTLTALETEAERRGVKVAVVAREWLKLSADQRGGAS